MKNEKKSSVQFGPRSLSKVVAVAALTLSTGVAFAGTAVRDAGKGELSIRPGDSATRDRIRAMQEQNKSRMGGMQSSSATTAVALGVSLATSISQTAQASGIDMGSGFTRDMKEVVEQSEPAVIDAIKGLHEALKKGSSPLEKNMAATALKLASHLPLHSDRVSSVAKDIKTSAVIPGASFSVNYPLAFQQFTFGLAATAAMNPKGFTEVVDGKVSTKKLERALAIAQAAEGAFYGAAQPAIEEASFSLSVKAAYGKWKEVTHNNKSEQEFVEEQGERCPPQLAQLAQAARS